MRAALLCILVFALAATGCVSRKSARMEAQQAYMRGQQQAIMAERARIQQERGPSVFVEGPVRNSIVAWHEGMTLSQAIVAAEYTGFMNPVMIRVLREGQMAGELKGIDLLHRQDINLQAGDTVVVVP